MKNTILIGFGLAMLLVQFTGSIAYAHDDVKLSSGQTIYVPAYSHIYSGNKEVPSMLAVTLSIRNTDPGHSIRILTVDYYETQGKLVDRFITAPIVLGPMGTTRYVIPQKDKAGGSGANFIVEWEAVLPVNPPIVETIMIGSRSSFTSRGQTIIPVK